ncbi:hypothetical protein GP486_006076 [Trichoglossum hirsutum]|uniref:ACB domain-containing protein n=1 Tax=Trichoglossum hirsutum TaxID=265104 RepID=A0A9P8L822_9PEZI|nr:hypothetical protein GP486_006076 [Trichoglossum hirsutum]
MSEVSKSKEFEKAAEDSRKLKTKPNNDDLLQLYALYKIGIQETPEEPGMFDFKVTLSIHFSSNEPRLIAEPFRQKGRAKKRAWQELVDEGVTPEEAQKRYVTLVEKLKETYGYDADKEPEVIGAGS